MQKDLLKLAQQLKNAENISMASVIDKVEQIRKNSEGYSGDIKKVANALLKLKKEVDSIPLSSEVKKLKEVINTTEKRLKDQQAKEYKTLDDKISKTESKLRQEIDDKIPDVVTVTERIEEVEKEINEEEIREKVTTEETVKGIRDTLESFEGDERLDASAIKNLPTNNGQTTAGGGSNLSVFKDGAFVSSSTRLNFTGSGVTVSNEGGRTKVDVSGGGSGSTISVDGTEVSDPDLVSTGDIDFVASGSDVTANINNNAVGTDELDLANIDTDDITEGATNLYNQTHTGDATGSTALTVVALQGEPLSATSPTDGKIWVYRTAGSEWTLEDKPAGGSNPALNDVTDVTITSVTDDEVLAYDNTSGDWINQTPAEAGLAEAVHTHTASDVTDFDTEVSNNTDVAANTAARHTHANKALLDTYTQTEADLADAVSKKHDAVTVTDSAEIDFTLTGQDITASLIAGSIDETKLDTSVNNSLDLADSALQSGDNISVLINDSGYLTSVDLTTDVSGDLPFSNISQIDTNRLLGRDTAGIGDIEALTGATARGILGLDTDDSPQFTGIELGHATDTTLTRASAGDVNIEGNIIYRAGGTDVPLTDGGTGASTASGARTNLGLAIGTDVQAYSANLDTYAANPLTAGEIGQLQNINSVTISNTQWGYLGALDQGLTTASSPQFSTIELGNASDTTLSRDSAGVLAVEGVVVPTISSTNTLTNKRINPRQDSQASTASITPDKADYDEHYRTAQAAGITINNATSPSVGDKVVIYITDNGTSRSISFGTDYVGLDGLALPTDTTASKTMEIGIVYVTATKAIVSYVEEA